MRTCKIFIISGGQGAGKTAKLWRIVRRLDQLNFRLAGFVAEGYWDGNLRSGFDLVNIDNKDRKVLCRNEFAEKYTQIGRFYFNPEAINYGKNLLNIRKNQEMDLLVIDEIGRFELQGKLWAELFMKLIQDSNNNLIITARYIFVDEIISNFGLNRVVIFDLNDQDEDIIEQISGMLK